MIRSKASKRIDELVAALLACASSADVFRDGVVFRRANARRANPKRDREVDDSGAASLLSELARKVITYERLLARQRLE